MGSHFRIVMDVIVLAGGFGSRLMPWTKEIPKPLLPILDKTMIEHVVEILPKNMIERLVIAAGYGIEKMRRHFSTIDLPYDVEIVEEFDPLGTGGAIANCKDYLSGGTFCVINGDLITSLRLEKMLDFHNSNGGIATISLWEVEDPSRFGVADYNSDSGKILRFQEKPPIEEAFSNLINAGTYILEPEIFKLMPKGAHSIERDVYEPLASTGGLNGFPFSGWFVDAGTPTSFIEASQVCISEESFSSGSKMKNSWFGENSNIQGNVEFSAIGKGVMIDKGASVKNSVILQDAIIEAGCNIEGCLIGMNTIITKGTVISNEIIDHFSKI